MADNIKNSLDPVAERAAKEVHIKELKRNIIYQARRSYGKNYSPHGAFQVITHKFNGSVRAWLVVIPQLEKFPKRKEYLYGNQCAHKSMEGALEDLLDNPESIAGGFIYMMKSGSTSTR